MDTLEGAFIRTLWTTSNFAFCFKRIWECGSDCFSKCFLLGKYQNNFLKVFEIVFQNDPKTPKTISLKQKTNLNFNKIQVKTHSQTPRPQEEEEAVDPAMLLNDCEYCSF
jgi:hypothetical protein